MHTYMQMSKKNKIKKTESLVARHPAWEDKRECLSLRQLTLPRRKEPPIPRYGSPFLACLCHWGGGVLQNNNRTIKQRSWLVLGFFSNRAPWCSLCSGGTGWSHGAARHEVPPNRYRDFSHQSPQKCHRMVRGWEGIVCSEVRSLVIDHRRYAYDMALGRMQYFFKVSLPQG